MANNESSQILLVMTSDQRRDLTAVLDIDSGIDSVETVDDAKPMLQSGSYGLLIVEETIPSPGWQALSGFVRKQDLDIPILICTTEVAGKKIFAESKKDDTFIADVLIKPYSEKVVNARVQSALAGDSAPTHKGATLPSHPLEVGNAG